MKPIKWLLLEHLRHSFDTKIKKKKFLDSNIDKDVHIYSIIYKNIFIDNPISENPIGISNKFVTQKHKYPKNEKLGSYP